MKRMGRWTLWLLAGAAVCVPIVLACDIPVFRFALEKWPPDKYPAIVFHKADLTGDAKALAEELANPDAGSLCGRANLHVVFVDVSKPQSLDETTRKVMSSAGGEQALPSMAIIYPAKVQDMAVIREKKITADSRVAWHGPFNRASVTDAIDSPMRRQIINLLLDGDKVPWILLESGNAQKDSDVHKRLEALLKKMTDDVLKNTVPKDTEAAAMAGLTLDKKAGATAPDRSAAPAFIAEAVNLPLSFPILRLSRTNPSEQVLVHLLTKIDPKENAPEGETVLYPIFGQGRVLTAIRASKMTDDVILGACSFLAAFCSCEVKEQNPGYDFLMSADWINGLKVNRVVKDETPPLTGVMPTPPETNKPPLPVAPTVKPEQPKPPAPPVEKPATQPEIKSKPEGQPLVPSAKTDLQDESNKLLKNVGITLVVAVVLLVIIGFALGRKTKED